MVYLANSKFPRIFLQFIFFRINGKTLFVNISAADDVKKLKEGDVITVKHSGVNIYGTLQFPQFYRERLDVKWTDLNKRQ